MVYVIICPPPPPSICESELSEGRIERVAHAEWPIEGDTSPPGFKDLGPPLAFLSPNLIQLGSSGGREVKI